MSVAGRVTKKGDDYWLYVLCGCSALQSKGPAADQSHAQMHLRVESTDDGETENSSSPQAFSCGIRR